jgi:hypothetical protein
MESIAAEQLEARTPRFSPDGKSIIFDGCNAEKFEDSCRIHVLNIATGEMKFYLPTPGQTWMQAGYSDAGDKLVFVTMPVQDRKKSLLEQRDELFLNTQIAIMNTDGSGVRVLTNNKSFKGMPVFSHDGKKILFVQSDRLRNSGATVAAYWDLWELNLETNSLELFAGRNGFYQMGLPAYFPDDEHVLINGNAPMLSLLKVTSGTFIDRQDDYLKKYRNSQLFKVARNQKLEPPILIEFESAQAGCLDSLGNIYFEAMFKKEGEGFRVRRSGTDSSTKNWNFPQLRSNSMNSLGMNISRDGRYVAMSLADGDQMRLSLLDTNDGQWRELNLEIDAHQINRK